MPILEVGQKVMAKWPKSSLYFPGSIIDLNDIEYLVRFEDPDETELAIKHRNVSTIGGFRRSSRSRSRSRSRGRTAKKAGKSPGRPPKSKAKVESKKQIKKRPESESEPEPEPEPEPKKEPTPIPEPKPEFEPVVIQEVKEVEVKADPIEPVVEMKTTVQTETETETIVIQRTSRPRSVVPIRQSARIAAMLDKNTDDEDDDALVNNIKEATAEPGVEETQTETEHRTLGVKIKSFFKSVGCTIYSTLPALATLKVLPLIVMALGFPFVVSHMCMKKKCTVQEIPAFPMKLDAYYSLTGLAMFMGFLLTQLLLYFVPIGRKVVLPNGASVRCNGFISLILTLVVIPVLMNFNVNVLAVHTHLRHLLVCYMTFALVLSLLLFFLARNAPDDSKNPGGNSGLFFPDLFVGRQISPCIGNLDVKHFLLRVVHLTLIIFSVIIIIKDLLDTGVYSPTIMVANILQIFLGVDMIWMEDNLFTTFEYNRRGCGLMTVTNYCGLPFVYGLVVRLVLYHRTEHEWYILTLIVGLYLVGYVIFRGANSQKHTYRINPSDPALCHLESIPTAAGTRLLVSGWWGIVRHPNILGNITILLAQVLLCGFDFALPWLLYASCIVYFVIHINEMESHCQTKYGTAWESYCSRIKCKLVPRIF